MPTGATSGCDPKCGPGTEDPPDWLRLEHLPGRFRIRDPGKRPSSRVRGDLVSAHAFQLHSQCISEKPGGQESRSGGVTCASSRKRRQGPFCTGRRLFRGMRAACYHPAVCWATGGSSEDGTPGPEWEFLRITHSGRPPSSAALAGLLKCISSANLKPLILRDICCKNDGQAVHGVAPLSTSWTHGA
jgi:hypothetical protein